MMINDDVFRTETVKVVLYSRVALRACKRKIIGGCPV